MGGWRAVVGAWMFIFMLMLVLVKLAFDAIVYEVDNYPRKPEQEIAWPSPSDSSPVTSTQR